MLWWLTFTQSLQISIKTLKFNFEILGKKFMENKEFSHYFAYPWKPFIYNVSIREDNSLYTNGVVGGKTNNVGYVNYN